MALIDVLPKFKYKPLELEPVETKLVPKPVEKVATAQLTPPTVTPVTAQATTSAPASQTLAPAPTKPRIKLPDVYKDFAPLAEAVSDSSIVNPAARAAVIAQMGLEKGWKTPGDFNYGNITAGSTWSGPAITRGDTDAQGRKITQKFRQYGSSKEFVDDYLSLLKKQYPAAYAELHSDNFDVDRFGQGLVGGPMKYATNPNYKQELKRVYETVNARINKTN